LEVCHNKESFLCFDHGKDIKEIGMMDMSSMLLNIENITIPNGLLGLPEWKKFSLQQTVDMMPVALLHFLEAEGLSLIVANPGSWYPEYSFDVSDEDMAIIDAKSVDDLIILAIINVESDPFQVTSNLVSPILINPKNKLGVQIVLHNSPFMVNQPLTVKTMLITLAEGLAGLPQYKHFILQIVDELMPVMLLVCKDEKRISFPLIDPWLINPDYNPKLSQEDMTDLGISTEKEASWFAIMNMQNEPFQVNANLVGPIVVNPKNGVAKQVILSNSKIQATHPIKTMEPGAKK
jgi:flagellar assembly factor FliW